MQKIGIGYENYKEFIDLKMYYVDKTLLIRDVIEKGGKTTLFTRPRRFGKTLAQSMLRTFFELELDRDGNKIDNRKYFEGKKIMEAGDDILSMMGQYPVIKMSLKSAKQPDFYSAFLRLREEIISEFSRHEYLLKSDKLNRDDIDKFSKIRSGETIWDRKSEELKSGEEKRSAFKEEVAKYATAIKTLSELLRKHHDKNVIFLIDEYDVPLENAYYRGFYTEMVDFIRSLFESALKTNDTLERAVITGCLRISKESIFTGLNNFEVNSIRGQKFGEYFGFTVEETETMLKAYGLEGNIDTVRDWYDGYVFGEAEVYNPWSVIKYVSEHEGSPERLPEPYWSNTSSNSIVRDLVEKADEETREELDVLINGGTIEKKIHEDITYDGIYDTKENLWNFLFFTGYMRKVSERIEGRDIYVTMRIPNEEVLYIYESDIRRWFEKKVESRRDDKKTLQKAVLDRDTESISRILTSLLKESISTFDSAESFYHGFLLSMLMGTTDYRAKSNREAGDGRPDIVLYPENPPDPALLSERKTRKKYNEMQDGLNEAFTQIRDKRYGDGILEDGYAGAVSFGICFCRKSCIAGICEN